MALIGYCRVSTADQELRLQLDALKRDGVEDDHIFKEKASGADKDRPELARMINFVRKGDVVLVWKLDRLARSLSHLVQIVETLKEKGAGLKVLSGSIDTTTAEGRLFFGIFASLAEFERELIQERVNAGIKAAQDAGVHCGRPAIGDDRIAGIKAGLERGESWSKIASRISISLVGRWPDMLSE
ncbi:MAG: recombinase family protein [Hyphomicrobiaceae bacterium]